MKPQVAPFRPAQTFKEIPLRDARNHWARCAHVGSVLMLWVVGFLGAVAVLKQFSMWIGG